MRYFDSNFIISQVSSIHNMYSCENLVNTICGEHLIPLVHVNDGVERHLKSSNSRKIFSSLAGLVSSSQPTTVTTITTSLFLGT